MTISTGITTLDNTLKGGYQTGTLCAITGPEASGKTAFLLASLVKTIEDGGTALFLDVTGVGQDRLEASGLLSNGEPHPKFFYRTAFTDPSAIEKAVIRAIKDGINLVAIDGNLHSKHFNPNLVTSTLRGSTTTLVIGSTSSIREHRWLSLLLQTHLYLDFELEDGEYTDRVILGIQKERRGIELKTPKRVEYEKGILLDNRRVVALHRQVERSRFDRDVILPTRDPHGKKDRSKVPQDLPRRQPPSGGLGDDTGPLLSERGECRGPPEQGGQGGSR